MQEISILHTFLKMHKSKTKKSDKEMKQIKS